MLRRSGDAGGIDQRITDRPLGSVPIAASPSRGYRGGLRGEAVFGDQPVVPRKEPRIEGLAGTQRIKCLLTVIANSGRQDGGHGHLVRPSPSPQRPHLNLRALIREAEAMLPFAMAITVGLPEIAATY
jgi:hypothetical protein